jgi:hypothetical protein
LTTALPLTDPPLTQPRPSMRALPVTDPEYTAAFGPTYAVDATLALFDTQPPPLVCQRPPWVAAGFTYPGSNPLGVAPATLNSYGKRRALL